MDIPISIYRKISVQHYFRKYFARALKRVFRLGITSHIINFNIKSYDTLKHFKLAVNKFLESSDNWIMAMMNELQTSLKLNVFI